MEKDLDKKLYNDYLNGEKEAFEILYNKYKNKIEYFIYNIVKDYQKAEDIAEKLLILLKDNNRRVEIAKKGNVFIQQFSWDTAVHKMLTIFEQNGNN